jgi:uncharacterized protein (DUF885 family)
LEQLDRALLVEALTDQIKGIDFKTFEMPVDQFNGIQILFPQISTFAPFDSVKHYDDYIARLNQIPERFEEVGETLKQGEKDGLLPPRFLLEKTIEQCKAVADPGGEANPFVTPLKQIPASFPDAEKKRVHTELIRVADEKVRPAYRKVREFSG